MPASRIEQWVSRIRVPRTPLGRSTNPISLIRSQWRQGLFYASAQLTFYPVVGRFSTSTVRSGNKPRRIPRSVNSTSASSSIFDQLFPSGQVPTATPHTGSTGPSLAAANTKTRDWRVSNNHQTTGQDAPVVGNVGGLAHVNEGDPGSIQDPALSASDDEAAILVVRNGSRSSLPSDFYRVAPRGAHLDGRAWSTMQAVQARDSDTMEPLDKYLLYFSSAVEATAYKDELERLAAIKDASEEKARMTLAPPDTSTMTIELVQGVNAIQQIPASHHSKDIMRLSLDTRNIVFIKLDGHQLTVKELKGLITADGERRNLAWKLTPSWGKGGIAVSLKGEIPRAPAPLPPSPAYAAEADGPLVVPEDQEEAMQFAEAESWKERPREAYFSRFFLSFYTVHDARRFIRSWHRRRFNVKDDESHVSVVNASLIW